METTRSSSSVRTWSSTRASLVRILLPGAVLMVLYGALRVLWFESMGLSLLTAILLASGIGLLATAGRFLNRTAIVSITEQTLSFRSGMGVFSTVPKTIPLEHIHTVRIVGANSMVDGKLHPSAMVVVYKAPARKMLHAEALIPLAGIPDGLELVHELVERTGAKVRVFHNDLDVEEIPREELPKRLGLKNVSTSGTAGS